MTVTDSQMAFVYRVGAVLLPTAVAFVATDQAVIDSSTLTQIGFRFSANILAYTPFILLPIWIVTLQVWNSGNKTISSLFNRFLLSYVVFVGVYFAVSSIAFRETKSIHLTMWPSGDIIERVESSVNVGMSWTGDSSGFSLVFDARIPETESQIRKAFSELKVKIID